MAENNENNESLSPKCHLNAIGECKYNKILLKMQSLKYS